MKTKRKFTYPDYKAIREELHRTDCMITEADFDTSNPNPLRIDYATSDIYRFSRHTGGEFLMKEQFDDEELDFMLGIIEENLTEDDCDELINDELPCKTCLYLEDCYHLANQKCDSQFAENINYGGYDTEEEFWENLLG